MTLKRFKEEEVAQRAGTTPAYIRRLTELGILEADEGSFEPRAVLRARVVLDLDAMGIDAEAVADALASGDLSLGYVEIGGRRPPRSDRTFADLSEEIGIGLPMLERIYVAFGLPRPTADELVREEDLGVLAAVPVLFGAGISEGESCAWPESGGTAHDASRSSRTITSITRSRSRSAYEVSATTRPWKRRCAR